MHPVEVLLKQGSKQAEIVRLLNLPKSTVSHHAKLLGLTKIKPVYNWARISHFILREHTFNECLKHYGMSRATLESAINSKRVPEPRPAKPTPNKRIKTLFARVTNLNPKAKGETTEATVANILMSRGLTVLKPVGDNKRYDLVLERQGSFYRLQVKTLRKVKETLIGSALSSTLHRRNGKKQTYKDQADYFIFLYPPTNQAFVIPVKEAKTAVRFRLTPPKNKQIRGIRLAEDYELK